MMQLWQIKSKSAQQAGNPQGALGKCNDWLQPKENSALLDNSLTCLS